MARSRPSTDKRAKKTSKKAESRGVVARIPLARPRTRRVSEPAAFSLDGIRWPTSWSSSRYDMHNDCPRQYLLHHVKKWNVAPPNSAMQRGTTIHMQAEAYLRGKTNGMPDALGKFRAEFTQLKALKVIPETEWVIKRDGSVTHWRDWKEAWLRSKLDAHHHFKKDSALLIIDFKTGRVKPKPSQVSLYASLSSLFIPADTVDVELWFLDHGETIKDTFTRSKVKELWKKWTDRADKLLAAREFPPKPGGACRWCTYRSNNRMMDGEYGPCEAWREA